MLRRTAVSLGFFSVLREELAKLPNYLSFHAKEGSQKTVDSASKTFEFLKGDDPSADPKKAEWQKKHREMYHAILAQQQAQAAEVKAKEKARRDSLSFMERMKLNAADATQALAEMTSMKAGAMALLQHCTASHAAEIAIEQGIDVKNVQMVLEKQAKKDGIGYEEVVVGYIDAPSASNEEVMAFAEKLHKACGVANKMHVEWRQRDAPRRGDDWGTKPEGSVDFESFASGKMPMRPSEPGQGSAARRGEAAIPLGMPGARRMRAADPYATRGQGGLRRDGEDDALHLPGVKSRKSQAHMEDEESTGAAGGAACGERVAEADATANTTTSTDPNSRKPRE